MKENINNPHLFYEDYCPESSRHWYETGITLRDLFAGLAMHAFQSKFPGINDMEMGAELAYKQADLMLTQREKQ